MTTRRRDFLGACAALSWLAPTAARAAAGDAAATKVLVGATPGGGTDLVARALAQELQTRLARTVTVENRPGAGGNLAAAAVAKADADGSTLLVCYTSHAINASLFGKLPFDPVRDFTPLCLLARSPLLLVARADFPASNLKELFALLKRPDARRSIGVAGVGSANHLAGEMLKKQGGLDLVSVPYKGAGPALADALGGQVDLVFSNVASAQELVAARKLKVLAVSTAERVPAYAEAMPVAELLPGFDYSSWYGLLGPAGLAAAEAQRLSATARAAVAGEQMRKQLRTEGLEPVGSSGPEFARFLQREIEQWAKVVSATGAKV